MAAKYSADPYRTSAYSADMRWRMVYQREGLGLPCRQVASNLNVDPSTVSRVVSRFNETGNVDVQPRSGAPMKLSAFDEFLIMENILERPDMYLHVLQSDIKQTTGADVDVSTICRFLKRNNFSRKKLSHIALQRNTELRAQFLSDISVYSPDMLLFIDETGCDRRDAMRKFGYSLIGKPAYSHKLLRGKRFSAIGILSTEGILDAYITSSNVNSETFLEFIDRSLLHHIMPFNGINPCSVVILDNASIHHVDDVVHAIQSVGALVHFLPPYSPDLNPIEEAFAKLKAYLRANALAIQAVPDEELEDFILAGISCITKFDCAQWIQHSGYQ